MKNKGRFGFSLAEVMVSLLLLSVISLVLTGLIPATITGMAKAAMRTNAAMLGENHLALLKQAGFGRLEATQAPHELREVSGVAYVMQVEVGAALLSDSMPMEQDVAKLVSVTVTWKDRNGEQKHVSRAVVFKRV